ncbi:MAG: M55 family metallopeptidase [Anaerolineaceae bacterium]|nr:M55 family metallopeptidase [Anaerolineaceae bacterium]
MKILMMTDLEGVAGVVSFEDQTGPGSRYYDAAKKLLTAEVNAAVEGLTQAGVEEVLVVDGHGPGAIQFEELHPAARLLHGRPLASWASLARIFETYTASIMIGQHAMAGVPTSNMNHTQNSRAIDYYQLNGRKIGEIAQFALFCGALGVPMIFLSGEEDACQEAQAFVSGIVTASVKQGLGRGSAISLSAPEAHRRIRAGVQQAVEQQRSAPIPPFVWKGPYVLEIRYFSTSDADVRAAQPGVERVDQQIVRMHGESLIDIIYR